MENGQETFRLALGAWIPCPCSWTGRIDNGKWPRNLPICARGLDSLPTLVDSTSFIPTFGPLHASLFGRIHIRQVNWTRLFWCKIPNLCHYRSFIAVGNQNPAVEELWQAIQAAACPFIIRVVQRMDWSRRSSTICLFSIPKYNTQMEDFKMSSPFAKNFDHSISVATYSNNRDFPEIKALSASRRLQSTSRIVPDRQNPSLMTWAHHFDHPLQDCWSFGRVSYFQDMVYGFRASGSYTNFFCPLIGPRTKAFICYIQSPDAGVTMDVDGSKSWLSTIRGSPWILVRPWSGSLLYHGRSAPEDFVQIGRGRQAGEKT